MLLYECPIIKRELRQYWKGGSGSKIRNCHLPVISGVREMRQWSRARHNITVCASNQLCDLLLTVVWMVLILDPSLVFKLKVEAHEPTLALIDLKVLHHQLLFEVGPKILLELVAGKLDVDAG